MKTTQAFLTVAFSALPQIQPFSTEFPWTKRQTLEKSSFAAKIRTSIPLAAVYGGDEYMVDDYDTTDYTYASLDDLTDTASMDFLDYLSHQCRSSLARLACAFAPAEHQLHPQDVESAHVIHVDGSHIEISAVLCEDDGCVQVPVPVQFPRSCQDGDLEECVLDNIEMLDVQAHALIADEEWREFQSVQTQTRTEPTEQERLAQSLQEEPQASELPTWWTRGELSQGLSQDCASMKYLLNEEEFGQELRSLAQRCTSKTDDVVIDQQAEDSTEMAVIHQNVVTKASVASVGPSGVILRAFLAETHQNSDGSDYVQEHSGGTIVVVPIPFPKKAISFDELRTHVLNLVSEV